MAPDMRRLLARLRHAAHDNVLDGVSRDARTGDGGVEDLGAEIDGVPACKTAAAAATGRAACGYDIGF